MHQPPRSLNIGNDASITMEFTKNTFVIMEFKASVTMDIKKKSRNHDRVLKHMSFTKLMFLSFKNIAIVLNKKFINILSFSYSISM